MVLYGNEEAVAANTSLFVQNTRYTVVFCLTTKRIKVGFAPNPNTGPPTRACDVQAIDILMFLESCSKDFLVVSGDGALRFGRLIAAGLASIHEKANNNWQLVTYGVNISEKGRQLVRAWKQGDRMRLKQVMGDPVPGQGVS